MHAAAPTSPSFGICTDEGAQSALRHAVGRSSLPVNSTQEQRLHTRVCFYDPVRANAIQHPKASWYLPAEDLSEGGLMLLAPEMLAVGLRLLLDIEPDQESEPFLCVGQVVWMARAGRRSNVYEA